MTDPVVWADGELRSLAEPAAVLAQLAGGVFETCLVLDGHVVALPAHLDRLDAGLAHLGLPSADRDALGSGLRAVTSVAPRMPRARLRLVVAPSASGRSVHHLVTLGAEPDPPPSCAVVVLARRRNPGAAAAGAKTTAYAENVLALAAAQRHGAAEALFATPDGRLAEGAGSNVFLVLDGVLHTPDGAAGILPGITRAQVLDECRTAGVEVVVGPVPVGRLDDASEVFLTSSAKGVLPVHAIDGRAVRAPGPVTTTVARLWHEAGRTERQRTDFHEPRRDGYPRPRRTGTDV